MAINKIQNHTLHELVDPTLGFDSDYTLKSMITDMAELAFQCLQYVKEMRPSMVGLKYKQFSCFNNVCLFSKQKKKKILI
jgi:hypothetical protein